MATIITTKFRIHQADIFQEALANTTTRNLYLFLAKCTPWSDETNPDLPTDNQYEESTAWNEMLALKKITSSNASFVIPRYDWDSSGNTVYFPWDYTDTNIFLHPTEADLQAGITGGYTPGTVYVMTDEYNVYECVSNYGGAKSTVKPTGTSTSIFTTGDGYRWKYLFTVSVSDALKYLTADWIPVKYITSNDGSQQWLVQQAATNGSVDHILVTNGGSGYIRTILGATAVAGTIGGSTLTLDPGSSGTDSYYNGAGIYMSNGDFGLIASYVGTTKTATLAAGYTWTQDPLGAGVTYDILPAVVVTGDGSSAKAKPSVAGGIITAINMISVGSNYKNVVVTITDPVGTLGTGKALIGPYGGRGKNPVKELGGGFCMINVSIQYNEGSGDFFINNDYRKIGLVRNVYDYGTTNLSSASILLGTKTLTLTSVTGTYLADEIVAGPSSGGITPKAKVVENISGVMKVVQDFDTGFASFTTSTTLTGLTSNATGTISSISNPDVQPYSGDIIYIEHRRAVSRSSSQQENIRVICEF